MEAEGKLITFITEQGKFLTKMEAEARLEDLVKSCSDGQQEVLKSGFDMLINPEKMGERFKFFSLFPSVLKDHLKKFPVNAF